MKKNILFALAVILLAGRDCRDKSYDAYRGDDGPRGDHGRGDDTLPLDKDGTYEISEGKLPVTLEVSEGRIRFINSRCPDHICEGYGWLSKEHDQAVCMPAGVVVSVEKGA